MALRTPLVYERSPCRFTASLSSAFSEWLLIFLLFINGLFSYLVTKFARYCKLQTPCLFCSRFDHVFDSNCASIYRDLICTYHKHNVSSLAYCHIHCNLADVREMCETCLLSFATEKKSNSETYRSLVGKLEINNEDNGLISKLHEVVDYDDLLSKGDVTHVPLLKSEYVIGALRKKSCSCCDEPFRLRSHAHRLLQTKTTGADIAESDVSLLGLTPRFDHTLSRVQDGSCTRQEAVVTTPMVSHVSHPVFEPLSHFGYTELKITSDSDSEVPISDEEDGNALIQSPPINVKDTSGSCDVMSGPSPLGANAMSESSPDEMAREEVTNLPDQILLDTQLPVQDKPVHMNEQFDSSYIVAKSHDGEELNLNKVNGIANPAESDVSCQEIAADVKDVYELGEAAHEIPTEIDESKELTSTDAILKSCQAAGSDPVLPVSTVMDLNDVYKLIIVTKGKDPSPKDASRVQEDLRQLLSQISQGFDSPRHDYVPTPRMRELFREDSRLSDASGTSGQLNLSKKHSLERNESGFESSLDGSIFNELASESAVDKLKRHLELERKSLTLLYKELEEERSASAIAANQAMAMITRLQEEKAAMQMEALQYQRMMEEQAEYDQEALQRSHDCLVEKEREVQDLEAELASYRSRFANNSDNEEKPFLMNEKEGNDRVSTPEDIQFADGLKSPRTVMFSVSNSDETGVQNNSLLYFEEEKIYIKERLKELEKKLHIPSLNAHLSDSGGHCENKNGALVNGGQFPEDARDDSTRQEESTTIGDSVSLLEMNIGENSHLEARHDADVAALNNHKDCSSTFVPDQQDQQNSTVNKETDVTSVEDEVNYLNARLEALEADRYFLEHMIKLLQNGNEGLCFVQEIACHLQELRKIVNDRGLQQVG